MKLLYIFVAIFGFMAVAEGTCPAHWEAFGESCYLFVDDLVSWSTAQEICRVVKGKMVEIDSSEENDFLRGQLNMRALANAWVGLVDFVQEGSFVLVSSLRAPVFTRWGRGEPNNQATREGGEDCVLMRAASGDWDDFWCDDTHVCAVVCEMESQEEELVG